jgi:hypothetical protein
VVDQECRAVRRNETRGVSGVEDGLTRQREFVERIESQHPGAVNRHADLVVLLEDSGGESGPR